VSWRRKRRPVSKSMAKNHTGRNYSPREALSVNRATQIKKKKKFFVSRGRRHSFDFDQSRKRSNQGKMQQTGFAISEGMKEKTGQKKQRQKREKDFSSMQPLYKGRTVEKRRRTGEKKGSRARRGEGLLGGGF